MPPSAAARAWHWGVLALILMDWGRMGKQAGFLAAFAVASTMLTVPVVAPKLARIKEIVFRTA